MSDPLWDTFNRVFAPNGDSLWNVHMYLSAAMKGETLTQFEINILERFDPRKLDEPYRTILTNCQRSHDYDLKKTHLVRWKV